jgi:hypothetical protein
MYLNGAFRFSLRKPKTFLRDHPPVRHDNKPVHFQAGAQSSDDPHQGLGSSRVALETELPGHGPALPVHHHAQHHLR